MCSDGVTNVDLAWVGPTPTPTGTPAQRCATNPTRSANQPRLVTMAQTALTPLEKQSSGRDKGFFLQIEGASIDKQDHAADPAGQIGVTVEFGAAVKPCWPTSATQTGSWSSPPTTGTPRSASDP